MGISIWTIVAGAGILTAVIGLWLLVELKLNPTSAGIKDPDTTGRITGSCGDTMEMSLKVKDGIVCSASYRADGCGPTSACAAAATRMAKGKQIDELPELIDYEVIEKAVGGLPEDHIHCAMLASDTLNEAVHLYMIKQRKKTDGGNPGKA